MTRPEVEEIRAKLKNHVLVTPVDLDQLLEVLDYVMELEEEMDGLYRALGATH